LRAYNWQQYIIKTYLELSDDGDSSSGDAAHPAKPAQICSQTSLLIQVQLPLIDDLCSFCHSILVHGINTYIAQETVGIQTDGCCILMFVRRLSKH